MANRFTKQKKFQKFFRSKKRPVMRGKFGYSAPDVLSSALPQVLF